MFSKKTVKDIDVNGKRARTGGFQRSDQRW